MAHKAGRKTVFVARKATHDNKGGVSRKETKTLYKTHFL